jgi:hypothetical protein
MLKSIPPLDDMRKRKAHLEVLRREVTIAIPGLVWIADGRHPWEVYRDEKFIGNSLVDPCSRILKREINDYHASFSIGLYLPRKRHGRPV